MHLFSRQVANYFWPEEILTTGIECILGVFQSTPKIATTDPTTGISSTDDAECKIIERIILKLYRLHRQAAEIQEERPDYTILPELNQYDCILMERALPNLPKLDPKMSKVEISYFLKEYNKTGFPFQSTPTTTKLIEKALPKLPSLHSNMSEDEENEFTIGLWIEEPHAMFSPRFLSGERRVWYFNVLQEFIPHFFKDPHFFYLLENKKITIKDIQEVNSLIYKLDAKKYLESKKIPFAMSGKTTAELRKQFFEIDKQVASVRSTIQAPLDTKGSEIPKDDSDVQIKRGSELVWTPEMLAKILESRHAGKSVKDIADEHHVSETLIYRKLELAKNKKKDVHTGVTRPSSIFNNGKN